MVYKTQKQQLIQYIACERVWNTWQGVTKQKKIKFFQKKLLTIEVVGGIMSKPSQMRQRQ